MSLELCAARMTAFLSRQPRKAKTRDYLKTLPKRPAPTVLLTEYKSGQPNPVQVARDEERYRQWIDRGKTPAPSVPRKDRRRPRAKQGWSALEGLRDASNEHCGICGKINDLWEMDIDHVVPRSAGGVNVGNRVPAHRICNRKKADRLPTGCELVWLAAVNAKLGLVGPSHTPAPMMEQEG